MAQNNTIKVLNISTSNTTNTFTINGCGKFGESKKHLSKVEAAILVHKLNKWLGIL